MTNKHESESNDSRPAIWMHDESKGVSRRDFLATSAWMTTMFSLPVTAICQTRANNCGAGFGKSYGLSRKIKNGEDSNTANDAVFKPGDAVPASGIYDVIHDKLDGQEHAEQHQITAIAGKTFPPCRGCQAWVRFQLRSAAEHIEAHGHFKR